MTVASYLFLFVIGYWSAVAAIKVSDIAARIVAKGCRVIGEVCSSDNCA